MKPKVYSVKVQQDDGWLIAEVTGLRAFTGGKGGIVTQGRDLDELALMVRDAIELLTDTSDFSIRLLLPANVKVTASRSQTRASKKRRRRAA
jgi:hypothetical protein